MDKRLQNKLKSYSALSAVATLVASSAEAQIVHTTVNYTGGFETYNIDIDGDGTVDFAVNAGATSFPLSSAGAYTAKVSGVQLYPNGGNRMIGTSGSYVNTVYAMNAGMVVNSTYYGFISQGALAGKFEVIATFYGVPITVYEGSFGQFGDGATKFVGVEFEIPLTGDTHYGWLRFKDVEQDGSSWTLVDMAYNTVAAESIVTGQTLSVKESKAKFGISATENSLEIASDASLMNASVEVVNMLGQTVATTTISSNTTSIAKTFGSGIYIVRIIDEKGKAITRKIRL